MPIYEFVCQACGERLEELMRLSDPDPVDCPKCGKPALTRALTAPSFRLSGSGWYETDFKKDGDKKRNLAGDAGAGASAGDSKPAADSKPASESKPAADGKPASSPSGTPAA
jgi:putative FmdB family regulatory protein